MEFSKKLTIGVAVFIGLFVAVSVTMWYFTGDWPKEIAEFFIWPILAYASYMAKSAYENKYKIQGGQKSENREEVSNG